MTRKDYKNFADYILFRFKGREIDLELLKEILAFIWKNSDDNFSVIKFVDYIYQENPVLGDIVGDIMNSFVVKKYK